MEICSNKDLEGKINKIPGMEQNLNDIFFEYQINSKEYIIGINLYNNTYIIISIALKKINNIVIQKFFTFEGIEKFDPEFFKPFNKNILILFKFLIRLLLSNLIYFKAIKQEDKNLYHIILNCLKDNSLRPIIIDLNSDESKEIDKDSAPVVENIDKGIKLKMNDNYKKDNQIYKIELSKIEHKYENSEIYKEIEIKFTNINESKVYYKYLNYIEILDLSLYYQLFNGSIEDIYDDLNIIIYHNNYKFEKNTHSINFYFQVFNIRKNSTDPYMFIFIKALDRERTESELQSKMKKYFQSIFFVGQYSEKIENIDKQNKEKSKNDNKKIKIEIKEQKDINENNKYTEKNKLIEKQIIINEPDIKNSSKSIFNYNLIEKENKTYKNNPFFINQKRNTNLTIDNFLIKRKKIEESNEFDFNNNNSNNSISNNNNNNKNNNNNDNNNNNKNNNNNDNNNNNINNINKNNNNNNNSNNFINWLGGLQLSDSNNNKLKKSINNSLEIKEKKEDKKLNIDKFQKENNKKSKIKSMNFKLDENRRYNINIDKVTKNYLQLLYMHPLDNDEEIKKIKDEKEEYFYLCTICDTFFKSRDSVREHQWKEHLKPFGDIIQKELKSQDQNKNKSN